MTLVQRKPVEPGFSHIAGPGDSELEYIEFGLLSLANGEAWDQTFSDRESVLVILGGRCNVAVGPHTWSDLGERPDVFEGKPTAVYLPPGSSCQITGRGAVEIAVAAVPAASGPEAMLITPGEVGVRTVGKHTFQREIFDIAVADNVPAQRLLVGETYNPPGLWSSYPPHKHDVHRPPVESKLEEVYYFRVKPAQGFGLQRIYGEGLDEVYTVRDRDTVTISRGYHPVVAAPGYQLYYLWVLAGEERIMHPREDPEHSWVPSQT